MSNPYITGITDGVHTSMEVGVPDFLQTVFYTEKSQMGCTMKMKGMMKSVSDKLGRYEHIRNEMTRLSHEIVLEMNEMNLFYQTHPYSETNKKAHLEKEVVNLYQANNKRIVNAGILTTHLKQFTTHKERKAMNNEKEFQDRLSQRKALSKDKTEEGYDPRYRDYEYNKPHEGKSTRHILHDTKETRTQPTYEDDEDYDEYLRKRGPDFSSRYEYKI